MDTPGPAADPPHQGADDREDRQERQKHTGHHTQEPGYGNECSGAGADRGGEGERVALLHEHPNLGGACDVLQFDALRVHRGTRDAERYLESPGRHPSGQTSVDDGRGQGGEEDLIGLHRIHSIPPTMVRK